jgi:hypothetical protein
VHPVAAWSWFEQQVGGKEFFQLEDWVARVAIEQDRGDLPVGFGSRDEPEQPEQVLGLLR